MYMNIQNEIYVWSHKLKKIHGHHKKNEEKVQKKSELKNLSYDVNVTKN